MPDITHPFSASSAWNTPIDPAHITYTASTTPENIDFRDQNKAFSLMTSGISGSVEITPVTVTAKVFRPNNSAVNENGTIEFTHPTISIPAPDWQLAFPFYYEWKLWTDLDGTHVWEGFDIEVFASGQYIGTLTAVSPATGTLQVTAAQTDGSFTVNYLCHVDFINGTGWGDPTTGVGVGIRAVGCSVLGGIVYAAELTSSIEHALTIKLDQRQVKAGFVPPAVSEDGSNSYSGTIPMGSHFALPPDLVLPSTLTPEGLALAKAYQKYGGFVVDTAMNSFTLVELTDTTDAQNTNLGIDGQWLRDNLVMTLPR